MLCNRGGLSVQVITNLLLFMRQQLPLPAETATAPALAASLGGRQPLLWMYSVCVLVGFFAQHKSAK